MRGTAPPLFAIGALIAGIAPIVLAFVYTRSLGADGYGSLEVAAAAAAAALHLGLLGADGAVAAALHGAPARRRSGIVTSALVGPAVASVGAGLVAAMAIVLLVPTEPLLGPAVMGSVIGVTLYTAAMAAVRQLRRSARFVVAHLATGVAWVVAGIVLVAGLELGIAGVFAASAIAMTVGSLTAIHGLRDMLARSAWRAEIGPFLRLGLPLVPAGLAIWSLALVDRFVLVANVPIEEVGYYGAAARLASGMSLLVAIVTIGWSPFVLAAPTADIPRLISWGLGAFAPIAGIVVIASALLGDVAITILAGPGYLPGADAVWLLAAASACYGGYLLVMVGYLANAETRTLALLTGVSAAANLMLTIGLVPSLGFIGAAIASALGYALWLAIALVVAHQRGFAAPPAARLAVAAGTVVGAAVLVRSGMIDLAATSAIAGIGVVLLAAMARDPVTALRRYRLDPSAEAGT